MRVGHKIVPEEEEATPIAAEAVAHHAASDAFLLQLSRQARLSIPKPQHAVCWCRRIRTHRLLVVPTPAHRTRKNLTPP